jgi:hypothetical protein
MLNNVKFPHPFTFIQFFVTNMKASGAPDNMASISKSCRKKKSFILLTEIYIFIVNCKHHITKTLHKLMVWHKYVEQPWQVTHVHYWLQYKASRRLGTSNNTNHNLTKILYFNLVMYIRILKFCINRFRNRKAFL